MNEDLTDTRTPSPHEHAIRLAKDRPAAEMTTHQHIAALALQGLAMTYHTNDWPAETLAKDAVELADQLLAQLTPDPSVWGKPQAAPKRKGGKAPA
ncbi:MAG: hypothetical protein H0X38_01250 [Planctomycetes bacterium]|nr:hypothetical protein [Planctomycetota bacterium]